MKIPVHVRDTYEGEGLFLGHCEHTELESVIELFNRQPQTGIPATLSSSNPWPLYLGDFDPDNYRIMDVQFAPDRQGKNLVFEIIIESGPDE